MNPNTEHRTHILVHETVTGLKAKPPFEVEAGSGPGHAPLAPFLFLYANGSRTHLNGRQSSYVVKFEKYCLNSGTRRNCRFW